MRVKLIFFIFNFYVCFSVNHFSNESFFNIHQSFNVEFESEAFDKLDLNDLDRYFLKKGVIHLQMGNYFFYLENYKKALKHLNLANNYIPENALTLFWLGQTYKKLNDFSTAKSYFDRAYQLDNRFLKLN